MKITDGLERLLWIGLAFFALEGYFLPNTFIGDLSPFRDWQYFSSSSHAIPGGLEVGLSYGIFVACLASYLACSKNSSTIILTLLFLLYGTAFAINSAQPRVDVNSSACYGALNSLIIGLAAVRILRSLPDLIILLVILGAAQSMLAIYDFSAGIHGFVSGEVIRAGGTYGHPMHLYTVALLCLPFAAVMAFQSSNKYKRIIFGLATLVIFIALWITLYRAAILGGVLGLFWLVVRQTRNLKPILILSLILTTSLMACIFIRSNGSVNQLSSNRSANSRFFIWRSGWMLFLKNPITGLGVRQVNISAPEKNGNHILLNDPDSIVLNVLDQFGTIGGLLFGLTIIIIIGIVQKNNSAFADLVGSIWLSFMIAGATDTTFGALDRTYSFALLGIIMGVTILSSIKKLDSAFELRN
jgi:O-antigen ligase